MAIEANEIGLVEIGITDHGYQHFFRTSKEKLKQARKIVDDINKCLYFDKKFCANKIYINDNFVGNMLFNNRLDISKYLQLGNGQRLFGAPACEGI